MKLNFIFKIKIAVYFPRLSMVNDLHQKKTERLQTPGERAQRRAPKGC